MADIEIRFDDGAAYEQFMGQWSQRAALPFLDWLAVPPGLRWVDIGCGNGAFTQIVAERCAPARVLGVDPSQAQIAYAREHRGSRTVAFEIGDALSLPLPDRAVDVAAMALVLFFVPDPAAGVREMARVVAPGGTVAAYMWDVLESGGSPMDPLFVELRELGIAPPMPPNAPVSRVEMHEPLWVAAGLTSVETRAFEVHRTFDDFEHYWAASMKGSQFSQLAKAMPADWMARFKDAARRRIDTGRSPLILSARANAIKGRVS
jgi:SAM-dependent methyltransferase